MFIYIYNKSASTEPSVILELLLRKEHAHTRTQKGSIVKLRKSEALLLIKYV